MKMPSILKRKKKLNATAARRSRALGLPEMDYEQMAEPNMKLSRALLIVLLLHIVAIAGIIAFNAIKTREATVIGGPEATAPESTAGSSTPAVTEETVAAVPNEVTKVAARTEAKAPDRITEKPKPAPKVSDIEDSGKIYVVVKGDNPVTIARHLHVNYDALLGLNQIEDPRKLQIGQKLHIPAAIAPTKHKSD
jgi:LysM repeat protein